MTNRTPPNSERETLKVENAKLKAALEQIAEPGKVGVQDELRRVKRIARAVLTPKDPQ